MTVARVATLFWLPDCVATLPWLLPEVSLALVHRGLSRVTAAARARRRRSNHRWRIRRLQTKAPKINTPWDTLKSANSRFWTWPTKHAVKAEISLELKTADVIEELRPNTQVRPMTVDMRTYSSTSPRPDSRRHDDDEWRLPT